MGVLEDGMARAMKMATGIARARGRPGTSRELNIRRVEPEGEAASWEVHVTVDGYSWGGGGSSISLAGQNLIAVLQGEIGAIKAGLNDAETA